jgi:type II secretion system protein I
LREHGFTLLEVMVAVAISAIAIVSVLELFSGSTRLARVSVRQTEALVVARAVLDRQLWQIEMKDGEQSGTEGDLRYRVLVEPVAPALGVPEEEEGPEQESEDYELKRIDVVVSWDTPGGEKSVALSTARLVELF